ncbi:MAG: DUF418 domain-containing protein [Deltaproteobacteria bacterium]
MGPVKPRERLVTLDILRGFALLGVLLGNLAHLFSGHWAQWHPAQDASDTFARYFITLVVQSKAQTLLTFLFGFGFANQLLRAEARHEPILGLYARRIVALLVFGVAHVTLLWWGDVLWTYAVTAPFLLLFLRVSNRTRLIVAVALILIPSAIFAVPGVWEHVFGLLFDPARHDYTVPLLRAMHGPSHAAVMIEQTRYAVVFTAAFWPQYFAWLVGNYLLGYIAGQLRWFERDGADHLVVFRRMFRIGLVLGGGATGLTLFGMRGGWNGYELSTLGMAALGLIDPLDYAGLALMFVAAVVLLARRPAWRRALAVVAPLGRMPLTTYLTQSLVCTFIIYGWGLGAIEWLHEIDYLVLGVAIFIAQIFASMVWLRYFRFGPLEWLWRWAVYARRPAFMVAPSECTGAP